MSEEREHALASIAEARAAGARLKPCCELVGLDVRTVRRRPATLVSRPQRGALFTSSRDEGGDVSLGVN